jgi:DNA primase
MIINEVNFNVDLLTILQELISQLRANDIQLIQKYKEGPTHIQICCPYHNNGQERRPSAGLRKEDGMFHCFACGEVHSLQEVISYCFGYTDDIVGKFGWQWLLKNFATVQVEERKDVDLDLSRSSTSRNNVSLQFVKEEELDKYRYVHPYMYKRGLTDEIIDLFDIGFDSGSQCITFPVRDIYGNCLFVARRSVKTKFFNYPEGVEKPLYGLYEIMKFYKERYYITEVIVCESMLDALSFWTIGRFAVALNGLGNELQFKQLRELPCRKIILATDMDERGLAARKRIRQNMQNTKIITEYIFPKGRKDANECTKEELMNLEEVFVY